MGTQQAGGTASNTAGVMWRAATAADIGDILAIQVGAHPLMQERAEVFLDKLALFPAGCRVLASSTGVVGYAIAHLWKLGDIPKLDTVIGTALADPNCVYIHDVALRPEARRNGAARAFAEEMAELARRQGLAALALVSVYGTVPIWQACHFRVVDDPMLAGRLAPYGEAARYMVRRLDPA